MSQAGNICRRIGNELYRVAFPIYRPLYSAFKAYDGRFERRALATQLSTGCTVVDAGANIGVYSRFFLQQVGPSGAVHSFEPSPDNFKRLRELLKGFPNVYVNQLAVSDRTEETILYISETLNVDHRTYPTEGEPRRCISINSTRLDDYFKPGSRVDLIKMDIQGYELHALRGAERVLDENPRIRLLLEFCPYGLKQAGASPEAFISFLQERGFSIFLPGENGLKQCDFPPMDSSDPTNYFNLFAMKATEQPSEPLLGVKPQGS
jgi:FkbM family methyltransferase